MKCKAPVIPLKLRGAWPDSGLENDDELLWQKESNAALLMAGLSSGFPRGIFTAVKQR